MNKTELDPLFPSHLTDNFYKNAKLWVGAHKVAKCVEIVEISIFISIYFCSYNYICLFKVNKSKI